MKENDCYIRTALYLRMFFFLSKIITFIFTPIFWVFTLLLFSFFFRNPGKQKKYVLIAIALLYLFSNSFILEEVNRLWEVPATYYKDLKKYEAGIVLGGMLSYDPDYDRIQFSRGADRLFQAVELYKMGFIKKIFFVGGSGSIEFSDMKEGTYVKRYLLAIGIPPEDVWVENESRNTRENAVNAKAILLNHKIDSADFLLITSGSHMRRALACFKAVGLAVSPYSVDRNASPRRRFYPDYLFIPSVNAFMWWDVILHEWIGLLVYKMQGYA
jgi:uncharacterized SAM-binding protein YcdF (DUF218 family)